MHQEILYSTSFRFKLKTEACSHRPIPSFGPTLNDHHAFFSDHDDDLDRHLSFNASLNDHQASNVSYFLNMFLFPIPA